MARRRPLKLDDSDNLVEMSNQDLADVKTRMIALYGADPSVKLIVVGSGGNLPGGPLRDRRLLSGGASLLADPLKPIESLEVEYSRIDQVVDSTALSPVFPDTSSKAYPVYLNLTNQIQSMTDSDFYDTFVDSAIDTLTLTGWSDSEQSGTYVVAQSNFIPKASLVSSTPVFVNTIADTEKFSTGSLPEESDQPLALNMYYLHKINSNYVTTSNPIIINDSNHLQELNHNEFDTILSRSVRYSAARRLSNTIRYSWDSSAGLGNNRGTALIDTILDSTGSDVVFEYYDEDVTQTQYDSAVPYIIKEDETLHQLVPAGREAIYRTYYLKIKKV